MEPVEALLSQLWKFSWLEFIDANIHPRIHNERPLLIMAFTPGGRGRGGDRGGRGGARGGRGAPRGGGRGMHTRAVEPPQKVTDC